VLELEDQLTDLGESIAWPPTPAIRISGGIGFAPLPLRRFAAPPRKRGGWVLAAAALLVIVAALAFTWLGLHTTIYRVPNPPTPSTQSPGALGANLNLGTRVATVTGAQRQLSWKITVPSSLGRPDAVYVKLEKDGGPSQGEVTLVYASAPGVSASALTGVAVLVTEARGSVNEIFFQKMLGPEATVEPVSVRGHSGYWVSGHPHDFVFVGPDGRVQQETLRLATNTLILDVDGTVVRIEGDMSKDQALAIAGALG
jgi:hypothetical protein